MPNRLAHETSPYLLQHRDNPVDWYPWGPEAMERARAEDRPILLSVGYSACHWCHVMEHESFSDPETARMMNERFVNVKVDREERPDVDSIYMTAVQQMTGHGGWPMTVFLTPDGTPFYGGTYFPPQPRHGLPSFRQLLVAVSEAYARRRDEVERSAEELRALLDQSSRLRPPPSPLEPGLLDGAFQRMAERFDPQHGGFGGAPKFPQPMGLEFLLRYWSRTGSAESLRMVEHTLRAMWRGGIFDHVGGGFARYSVDARWLVPHFEKMLYDNAQLARLYVHAYQATRDEGYRRVADEVLGYALREMRAPGGGYYSSQDADSEGEEGKFYVWTAEEVDTVLGVEEGRLFRGYYDVEPGGNWEGRSILHVERSIDEAAVELGVAAAHLEEVVARGIPRLYEARSRRVWPGRDEKVLAGWNAMMLRALAEAAWVFDSDEYRDAAASTADFLLRELRRDGRLQRSWKEGVAKIDAFLDDHALLVDALVSVYEATFDPRWVDEARALADSMLERFWDEAEGAFYDAATDGERLVVRPRDIYDNATPSGTSAATLALLRLARLAGEPRYERVAATVLEALGGVASRIPQAFGHLLCALDFHLATPREVAVVGEPAAPETAALLDGLRARYRPNVTRALRDPARPEEEVAAAVPLLAGREPVDGRPAAYVCERFACRRPVTTTQELEEAMGR